MYSFTHAGLSMLVKEVAVIFPVHVAASIRAKHVLKSTRVLREVTRSSSVLYQFIADDS